MKYAFFDLDGTLIPVDSSILWAETLLSHVGKDEKQLRAERIQYDVDYKNGCLDINKFEDFEMKLLARFPRRELDELRVQYLSGTSCRTYCPSQWISSKNTVRPVLELS